MNTRAASVVVAVAMVVEATAETGRAPANRPRLTPELRQRVAEISQARTAAGAGTEEDVLTLEPVVVKERYYQRPQQELPTDHPFTWRDGGTFVRRDGRHFTTAVKLQANPNGAGFDLLSFSW